ncbi:MAG: hypothetical protein EA001_02245 [Oscillatoriales cyanobacterium]|nr:MAG: hypothetical protein EA001_02245 [Oscillatoriales cyanobacterium]
MGRLMGRSVGQGQTEQVSWRSIALPAKGSEERSVRSSRKELARKCSQTAHAAAKPLPLHW